MEDLNESDYQVCSHCGRLLHRTTVWRHIYSTAQAQSLTNALDIDPDLPLHSPPPSPDHISLTSTERALSPLHFHELGDGQMDMDTPNTVDPPIPRQPTSSSIPLRLATEHPTPMPTTNPNTTQLEPSARSSPPPFVQEEPDTSVNLATIHTQSTNSPLIEELDLDILNSTAPPPVIPTAEEIYERARFGIADEEEDSDPLIGSLDLGMYNIEGDDIDLDDILYDPLIEMDEEIELNAARARLEHGIPEDSPEWMALKTFKLQMEVNLGHNAYQKFRQTFQELDLPSLKVLRRDVHNLSSLHTIAYHCCPNSCICYVGAYTNRQACHHCHAPRFKADGSPAKLFHYIPIVPQIKALYAGRTSAAQMRYRSDHHDDNFGDEDGTISDVYDSELYKRLRDSYTIINGRVHPFKYFDDPRDVFLTGMTDGFQLFKKGKQTAWPLIFVNNNLSPSLRYKRWNAICVGLIPGPRKPKEHDSFMYVVVEDLAKAAMGTPAYDALEDSMFTLRVYCPLKCGDMPAMASAYTGGKHHGAQHPCRACPIEGIRILDSSNNLSFYLPIIRPPGYPEQPYSLTSLPLRTHSEYIRQAKKVDEAPTQVERKRLSQLYGINHTPIAAQIPGIMFPFSFPFEFMHLLENTIENYVALVSGNFKSLGEGTESFIIPEAVWKEIGIATLKANATVPSCFGRRIPNIAEDRTYFTAEGYIVWATLYAPILLRDRFRNERYYHHWMKFISIVQRCMQFGITTEEVDTLRADIHEWYTEYERIFYQYDGLRLPACLITIHAWIHLPDMIKQSGPLWGYWTWVMERYCGLLTRAITSRKHPYASLNRCIFDIQTLHAIRHTYDLHDRLPVYTAMYTSDPPPAHHDPIEYPELTLLHPRRTISFAQDGVGDLRRRIAVHLATRYNVNINIAAQAVPTAIIQWGRALIKDADLVYSHLGYGRREDSRRDASFIQYELLVDIHAHRRSARPVYKATTFFGRLDRIFICEIEPNEAMGVTRVTPLLLMDIKICNTQQDRFGFYEFSTYRHSEVVDGTAIRALVGRIMDRGKWVFVRRSGTIEHAEFGDEEDEEEGADDPS